MSTDEWLTLPNGALLYLPPLKARASPGCPSCGATIFLIREPGSGVSCPKCVRRRPGERTCGRIDMAGLRVVAGPDDDHGTDRRGDE